MGSLTIQQRLGALLIAAGLAGLVYTAFRSLQDGGTPAISLFLVIIGLIFYFPTLLEGDLGTTSTMRVAVLMLVSLFIILTVKVGWHETSLASLKLDPNWVWVLAAALGGKAAQSFSENASPDGSKTPSTPQSKGKGKRDEQDGIEESP